MVLVPESKLLAWCCGVTKILRSASRARTSLRRLRVRSRVRWGNLRRTEPFSRHWGLERGTPVDRVLIERFLHDHRIDVGGRVLEVTDAGYSHRFGEDRLKHATVLDIDRTNERATLIADLGEPDSLPVNAFDCIILTQTLHIISNDEVACRNLWRSLTPGGVLLLTAPVVSGLRTNDAADYWRYTPMGLARLLSQTCD